MLRLELDYKMNEKEFLIKIIPMISDSNLQIITYCLGFSERNSPAALRQTFLSFLVLIFVHGIEYQIIF